jgi:hypothetical protein
MQGLKGRADEACFACRIYCGFRLVLVERPIVKIGGSPASMA